MAGLVPAIHAFLAESPQERRGCPRRRGPRRVTRRGVSARGMTPRGGSISSEHAVTADFDQFEPLVGRAKARSCAPCPPAFGGHSSLCPPYGVAVWPDSASRKRYSLGDHSVLTTVFVLIVSNAGFAFRERRKGSAINAYAWKVVPQSKYLSSFQEQLAADNYFRPLAAARIRALGTFRPPVSLWQVHRRRRYPSAALSFQICETFDRGNQSLDELGTRAFPACGGAHTTAIRRIPAHRSDFSRC
jgi:hypothetical protein